MYRLFITPKDIQLLTGKSYTTCRRYLQKIKDFFEKAEHQKITFSEYAEYCGIEEIEIYKKIRT